MSAGRSVLLFLVSCAMVLAVAPTLRAEEPSPPPAPDATKTDAARASRLQGTAILGRNRPVTGATILVRASSRPGEMYVTATDAKGAFRLDGLPDGTYDVEFRRDGFETLKKEKIEVRFPFRAIVEVTMKPLAQPGSLPARSAGSDATASGSLKLEGIAVGQDGRGLSDVLVRLVRTDAAADPREVRSGEDGTFTLDALAPGAWELESRALAFLTVRADLSLVTSSHLRLVLVPQPTTYEPPPEDLIPTEEPIPPPG